MRMGIKEPLLLLLIICPAAYTQLLRPGLMNLGVYNPETKQYEKPEQEHPSVEEDKSRLLGQDGHDLKNNDHVLGQDGHNLKNNDHMLEHVQIDVNDRIRQDIHDYRQKYYHLLGKVEHHLRYHTPNLFGENQEASRRNTQHYLGHNGHGRQRNTGHLFGEDGHGVLRNTGHLLGKDGHGLRQNTGHLFGEDGHDLRQNTGHLLGQNGHGRRQNYHHFMGQDGHGVRQNTGHLLGQDGHGVRQNTSHLLGQDGHGVRQNTGHLLGKDGHGVRQNTGHLLGQDEHGVRQNTGHLLGQDGHDFLQNTGHLLGQDGHDFQQNTGHLLGQDGHDLQQNTGHLAGKDGHDIRNGTKSKSQMLQALFKFRHFMEKHNKTYLNNAEFSRRFSIFSMNLKKIDDMKRMEQGSATYGVTKFADLSAQEFSRMLGFRPSLRRPSLHRTQAQVPSSRLPKSFDWRKHGAVTPVKNQGMCGSCWAFSVTGNVEGQWYLRNKKLLSLSEQELVDCDSEDQGCEGGLPENAYDAIMSLGGLETEAEYPYEGKEEKCHLEKSKMQATVSGSVELPQDETKMAQWLHHNGPISIGINAATLQFYWGGVVHPPRIICNPSSLDHGMLIVGYGVHVTRYLRRVQPYWTVKNSWGPDWGEQGYVRIYRGDGTCGLNTMATSAVVPVLPVPTTTTSTEVPTTTSTQIPTTTSTEVPTTKKLPRTWEKFPTNLYDFWMSESEGRMADVEADSD